MIRRKFVKVTASIALAGCLALPALPSIAADVTMNLGYAAPEESVYGLFASLFKERVEQYSDGAIEVKIRCCGQISSEDEAFKAMQLGTVDGYFITSNNISPHWPLMDVTVLPYIFHDVDHLKRFANGPVGEMMAEKLQADTSVHLLAYGAPGYRDFYNSKRPINTMADMEGLKIRVPKNEVMLATFEAFGAEPVPLAWSETPTALQTGTVDGGDNGTPFIRDMKFYEFEKHLVILEHFIAMSPLLASDAFMQKLSDDQRAAVMKAAKEAGDEHTKIVIAEIEEIRNWLSTEGGMAMTRPDKTEFIQAAKGVQQAFAEERGQEFVDLLKAIEEAAE